MTRSSAREIAVHIIFSLGFDTRSAQEVLDAELTKERFQELSEELPLYEQFPNEKQERYIRDLVQGVFAHGPELDDCISRYSVGWAFARIPRMAAAILPEKQFRIYISALTQLAIDQHNPIPPEDGRLLRRIVRDARTRGYSAEQTMEMWPAVRTGEEVNILPFQENADVFFNSACVYELAVLKQYAEPLLFDIQPSSLHYEEARRLLKFLDYFLGISSEDIPKNSLLREFIG